MGIRCLLQHEIKRAQPITQEMLLQMVDLVDIEDQRQLSIWVSILFGFHLFLRKSNLVPVKRKHDVLHQLSRADIHYAEEVLVAKIKWSKTNQFGEKLRVPVIRDRASPIDPVSWLLFMIKKIPAQGYHNPFSFTLDGQVVPVTYRDLTCQLREWLQQMGFNDVSRFSSHSLHRGGTTHAFNRRVPERTIQQLGSWASEAYKKYIEVTLESRLRVWYMISRL